MSNDRNQSRGTGNRLSEQTVLAESVLASTSVQPRITSVVDNDGPNNTYVRNQGSTDDSTPLLRGWGEPGATLTITKSTDANDVLGTVTVDQNGMWSYQVPANDALANGGYALIARQFNDAGQQISRSEPYFVNVAAPVSATTPVTTPDLAVETEAAPQAAPAAPTLDSVQDNVSVWGGITSIQNGQSTQDLTPTLRGRGEPGATVTISDGDQVLGTTKVGMFGTWTYQVSADAALESGTYELVVSQTNTGGQTSLPSAPYVITVLEATPPPAPVIEIAYDNVTPGGTQWDYEVVRSGQSSDDRTPLLQGRAERGATVTISVDGDVLGTVIAGPFGNWEYQVPDNLALTNGTHELVVSQVAQPGGPSSQLSESYVITVIDTATGPSPIPAPAAPIIDVVLDNVSPNGAWQTIANGQSSDDRTPYLQGRGEAGATLTISYGDQVLGSVTVGRYGDWQFQVPNNAALDNGTYEFSATQVNQAGVSSPASQPYVVTVDAMQAASLPPPVIETVTDNVVPGKPWDFTFVGNGESSDDRTPFLQGRGEPGATVKLSYGDQTVTVPVNGFGMWSYQVPTSAALANGTYEFVVSQTNRAGQSSPASEPYVITVFDSATLPSAPTITEVLDGAGAVVGPIGQNGHTDDRMPGISGIADPGSIVTIYDGTTVLGSTQAYSSGKWVFYPKTELSADQHDLSATAGWTANGPQSAASEVHTIFTDLTSVVVTTPTIDALIDNIGPVTGELTFGEHSDDRRPTLVGTADPGALVTVSVALPGGDVMTVGSVHADPDGRWDLTPKTDLPAGQSYFEAVASIDGVESGVSDAHSLIVDVPVAADTAVATDMASLDMGILDLGNVVNVAESKVNGGDDLHKLTLVDLLALDTRDDLLAGDPVAWLSQANGNQLSLEDVTGQLDISPDAITTGGVEHSYSFSVSNEFDLHVQELATQAG